MKNKLILILSSWFKKTDINTYDDDRDRRHEEYMNEKVYYDKQRECKISLKEKEENDKYDKDMEEEYY